MPAGCKPSLPAVLFDLSLVFVKGLGPQTQGLPATLTPGTSASQVDTGPSSFPSLHMAIPCPGVDAGSVWMSLSWEGSRGSVCQERWGLAGTGGECPLRKWRALEQTGSPHHGGTCAPGRVWVCSSLAPAVPATATTEPGSPPYTRSEALRSGGL